MKKRILIVDDLSIFREPITMALESSGFRAISAASGHQALEEIQKNISPFDLFLIDYSMPGMSGVELIEKIKIDPAWRNIPIIMLTDIAEKEVVSKAISLGVSDYVLKSSFSLDILIDKVKNIVFFGDSPSTSPATSEEKNDSPASLKTQRYETKLSEALVLSRVKKSLFSNVLPSTVFRALALADSPDKDCFLLADTIKSEPNLATRIMRSANSAQFSHSNRKIANIEEAVSIVGFSAIKDIIATSFFFQTDEEQSEFSRHYAALWKHSFCTARLMDTLHKNSEHNSSANLTGLCHDFAEMMVQQVFPEEYQQMYEICQETEDNFYKSFEQTFVIAYSELMEKICAWLELPEAVASTLQIYHRRMAKQSNKSTPLAASLGCCHLLANGLGFLHPLQDFLAATSQRELETAFGIDSPPFEVGSELREEIATAFRGLSSTEEQEEFAVDREISKTILYYRQSSLSSFDSLRAFLENFLLLERIRDIPEPAQLKNKDGLLLVFSSAAEVMRHLEEILDLNKQTCAIKVFCAGSTAELEDYDIPALYSLPISTRAVREIFTLEEGESAF